MGLTKKILWKNQADFILIKTKLSTNQTVKETKCHRLPANCNWHATCFHDNDHDDNEVLTSD